MLMLCIWRHVDKEEEHGGHHAHTNVESLTWEVSEEARLFWGRVRESSVLLQHCIGRAQGVRWAGGGPSWPPLDTRFGECVYLWAVGRGHLPVSPRLLRAEKPVTICCLSSRTWVSALNRNWREWKYKGRRQQTPGNPSSFTYWIFWPLTEIRHEMHFVSNFHIYLKLCLSEILLWVWCRCVREF